MKFRVFFFFSLAVLTAVPLAAQLVAPNGAGASIGHVHLNVHDVEAQQHFLTELGGTLIRNEKLLMVQFPGIYIAFRKQDPTGAEVGSVVNHFGLHVKSLADWLPKWEAAGLKIQRGNNPKQLFVSGPDNIRVEIIEDASIPVPVMMHHIHMYVPDPAATQAWYVKNFGAIAGKRNANLSAVVPGAEISIGKSDTELLSTRGHLIDHIGFEIKDLDQFVKKLQAAGVQVEVPGIRKSTNVSQLRFAFITDPWGTYIELTEGLSPSPVGGGN